MLPVRCYTCGKVLGNREEDINKLLDQEKTYEQIFKILKLSRYCCKRMIISNIDYLSLKK